MKSMLQPDATVVRLALLQANANALSASVKMKPPWQIAWPLSMSARTVIVSSAYPGPIAAICMPIACDARSRENMPAATRSASDCASCGVAAGWCSPMTRRGWFPLTAAESRRALGGESGDAFPVIGAATQLALQIALEVELRRQ